MAQKVMTVVVTGSNTAGVARENTPSELNKALEEGYVVKQVIPSSAPLGTATIAGAAFVFILEK